MMPLDDMLLKAQNGAAIGMVSRQFDLTRDQTVAAMEALLPAFSQGLKRSATTPEGMTQFLQALAGGDHAKYMEDMSKAFSQSGVSDGNDILGFLFGSKEVSRAVTDHAARATGIGQDILKQMLPALASMLMGGLFQQSTGKMNSAASGGFGTGGNIFGEMIEQMMRQGQAMGGFGSHTDHSPSSGAKTPDPFDNPFGRMFENMLSGQMGVSPGEKRRDGSHFNETARQSRDEERSTGPAQKTPHEELFGQMFETSRKTQDNYRRGMEVIFDQFMKGTDRQR